MPTPLARSVRLLAAAQKKSSGVDVRYISGGDEIPLIAIPAQADIEDVGVENETIIARADDWIIEAEDLQAGGVQFLPKPGHKIVTEEEQPRTFEVVQRGNGAGYRPTDQTKILLRVFCIETRTTPS